MHTASHSIALRAPPAARTKVRWQPYSSIPSSSMTASLPSPQTTYLNTPPASVAVSSPFSLKSHRPRQAPLNPVSQTANDSCVRDILKNKLALGLVDQAVKSLCEIWRAQDIPSIFVNQPNNPNPCNKFEQNSSHIPNPKQNILPSPAPSSPRLSLRSSVPSVTSACSKDMEKTSSKNCLLPIKGFVHEVLRRSRTSGYVLQTALCYIEAIRPKISELIRKEKAGETRWKEPELGDRIIPATDAELQQHAEESMSLENIINTDQCTTTEPTPSQDGCVALMADCDDNPKATQPEPYPSTVERISPLLCPRRSFLAALILASKFIQDKCYSNRAWAKLSGLSPREIGQCERALGEALEWRLWVGKLPVLSQPNAAPANRALLRTRSESCLQAPPSEPFFIRNDAAAPPAAPSRMLRRSSTLPADVFASDPNMTFTAPDMVPVVQIRMPALTEIKNHSPGSPSSTPPLTYSPTSTDSSGGDRTIQVSFQEPLEETCHVASNFDAGCMPCLELSDQLTRVAASPLPPLISKGLVPIPGLESTVTGRRNVSDITLTMSGDNLGVAIGPLEEYTPYTWRVGVTLS